MKKNTIIILLILIFITTVLLFVSNNKIKVKPSSDNSWLTYINQVAGYKINYPSNWWVEPLQKSYQGMLADSETSINIWTSDPSGTSRRYWVRIMVEDNPFGLTANEWAEKIFSDFEKAKGVSIEYSWKGPVKLSSNNAYFIKDIITPDVYEDNIYVTRDNLVYVINYPAEKMSEMDGMLLNPKENFKLAQDIVNTFELIDIKKQENNNIIQNLFNGFTMEILPNWKVGSQLKDAVNTVKFGSPAQVTTLYLKDIKEEEIYVPSISAVTFTIDERLSAKDVTNLINDEKIADKITAGTDNCYSSIQDITVAGIPAYAYAYDNTNLELCNIATEIGISSTMVVKKTGDSNTLILIFGARNKEEYFKLLPDFQKMWQSIQYNK